MAGLANTRELFVQGCAPLAAPVFDNEGQPVLVMALVAQIVDLPAPATPDMEAELRAAAQAASVQLGYLLETPDQV
ncbi:MAG: hypothetical protein JOZ87_26850 [Chloroflexi bacterium]|nr:hypothetical protein [Chloroflexota bacterium]